ncbi:hypothetical protein CHUAL_009536 [Chamberlinius hualienensis]
MDKMSSDRVRRVRDVYNRFEAHRSGHLAQPPPPLISSDVYRHMNVDPSMISGRNRRYLLSHNVSIASPLLMPNHHQQPMEIDQPADLSVKRDSSSMSIDLSRHSSYSSSSRHLRNLYRGSAAVDVADEDGVLDLASRPPRVSAEPLENGNCKEVIVLSDEEGEKEASVNGTGVSDDETSAKCNTSNIIFKELTKEEVEHRQRLILKLKENLRCEEMKLVLLKKLQLSHQLKDSTTNVNSPTTTITAAAATPSNSNNKVSQQNNKVNSNSRACEHPPPLMRGQNSLLKTNHYHSSQHVIPPSPISHGRSHGPPPLIQNHNKSHHHLHHQMIQSNPMRSRQTINTPPNVVLGFPINSTQSQVGNLGSGSSVSQILVEQQQVRGADAQTTAQRQAAAKLALRKQLEKTLLQIPPPKPPPPELHFIPNPSNTEFIYLVGLESVVNFITEGDQSHDDEAPKPFSCVQCGTDFTPVWKWENTKKGTVICEQCVTSNIKKALKAEHTNRLKTAFVKALQQEQEIEQRMAQVGSASPSPPPLPPPLPPQQPQQQTAQISHQPSLKANVNVMQLPKMNNESMRLAHVSASTHQQLLRLPINQPLPAHMLAPLNPFLAQAYQYQLLSKNSLASPELHRQYLLDMIPPRSLSQQGHIN